MPSYCSKQRFVFLLLILSLVFGTKLIEGHLITEVQDLSRNLESSAESPVNFRITSIEISAQHKTPKQIQSTHLDQENYLELEPKLVERLMKQKSLEYGYPAQSTTLISPAGTALATSRAAAASTAKSSAPDSEPGSGSARPPGSLPGPGSALGWKSESSGGWLPGTDISPRLGSRSPPDRLSRPGSSQGSKPGPAAPGPGPQPRPAPGTQPGPAPGTQPGPGSRSPPRRPPRSASGSQSGTTVPGQQTGPGSGSLPGRLPGSASGSQPRPAPGAQPGPQQQPGPGPGSVSPSRRSPRSSSGSQPGPAVPGPQPRPAPGAQPEPAPGAQPRTLPGAQPGPGSVSPSRRSRRSSSGSQQRPAAPGQGPQPEPGSGSLSRRSPRSASRSQPGPAAPGSGSLQATAPGAIPGTGTPTATAGSGPTAGSGKHLRPPAIYIGPVKFVPPPPDPVIATTPPPPGHSPCSSGTSPISLGRPTFWKISSAGHGATEARSQKDQRITTNKYYGRLRDRFYMQNDGNNLVFYFNETHPTSELTMKVAEWDDEYVFAKGIMHWGDEDGRGSEHTMHGVRFPMEIQFVHYKRSAKSLEQAQKVRYGVMIASVLYQFSGFDKDYMDPLISQGPIFRSPGPIKQVHGPLDMMLLYPGTLEHYEYEGSMTTTPCVGGVRRIVFANPVGIGRDQLELLRIVLNFANGNRMVDNYRELQDGSGRKIIFNPTLHQFNVTDVEWLTTKDPGAKHWRTLRQD